MERFFSSKACLAFFSVQLLFVSLTLFSSCNKDEDEVVEEPAINGICPDGKHPHAIDLGLGVKWSCCNVGANLPEEYGDYFAWGETKPKSEYTEENSVTWKKSLGDICGNAQYDAARANWGGSWRMPTISDLVELQNQCSLKWTIQNGVNGRLVTGPNGNSIFLPAAGRRYGTSLYLVGEYGNYWSSSPYGSVTQRAYSLLFDSSYFGWSLDSRLNGLSVRPVSD